MSLDYSALDDEARQAAAAQVGEPSPAAKADALLQTRLGPAWFLYWQTRQLMRPSKLWPGLEYYIRASDTKVRVIKECREVASLCVESRRGEPESDRVLTILDLLETDERRLWEMGNAKFYNAGAGPVAPATFATSVSFLRQMFDPSEMSEWWWYTSAILTAIVVATIVLLARL